MEVANIEANYSMGYFNSIGNGSGKIMNVDHINRHEILNNNNRMVIYCNEKTKNRYLNCFKKNQIFIRYQAKIANKRHELNGEGMKVSGMYIKLTKPIVQDIKCNSSGHYLEISIEVQKVDSKFPFEFYLNKPEITQMCNWYTSGRGSSRCCRGCRGSPGWILCARCRARLSPASRSGIPALGQP